MFVEKDRVILSSRHTREVGGKIEIWSYYKNTGGTVKRCFRIGQFSVFLLMSLDILPNNLNGVQCSQSRVPFPNKTFVALVPKALASHSTSK